MKRTSTGHFIGTLREQKRAAYIAGAEATLDLVMKRSDKLVKGLPDSADGRVVATALMQLTRDLYADAIRLVIARTPYEPAVEERPFSKPAVETPTS